MTELSESRQPGLLESADVLEKMYKSKNFSLELLSDEGIFVEIEDYSGPKDDILIHVDQ